MICRVWHGWTTSQNADAYERLLKEEIFLVSPLEISTATAAPSSEARQRRVRIPDAYVVHVGQPFGFPARITRARSLPPKAKALLSRFTSVPAL